MLSIASMLEGRTVWLGDGADEAAAPAWTAGIVSVSLAGLGRLPHDKADIALLRDNIAPLLDLRAIVDAHAERLRSDDRTIYAANLLGVAGRFAAGFNSFDIGLLSNLGAAVVVLRRWRTLARLTQRGAERRPRPGA